MSVPGSLSPKERQAIIWFAQNRNLKLTFGGFAGTYVFTNQKGEKETYTTETIIGFHRHSKIEEKNQKKGAKR